MNTPWLLLGLVACTSGEGGPTDTDLQGVQIGEEGDESICIDTRTEASPGVEAGTLGFTPEDLVAVLTAEVTGTLQLSDGSSTPLTVSMVPTGPVSLMTESPREGIDPTLCIGERLEVGVDVQVVAGTTLTVAGTAEAWAVFVDRPLWTLQVAEDDIGGTLGPTTFDPADYDTVRLWVSATHDALGWGGTVQWEALHPDGDRGEQAGSFTED
jgi:hypothetical protein